MNCPGDEILRTHLDGELSGQDKVDVSEHLICCAACQERFNQMVVQNADVSQALATLGHGANQGTDAVLAYAHFRAHLVPELSPKTFVLRRLFAPRWRAAWGLASAALVISVLVGFAPARTWAQKVLAMLRIQKVTVVSLDPTTLMSSAEKDDRPYKLIDQFISDHVVVTIDPGKPQLISNSTKLDPIAGFHVRTLSSLGRPDLVQLNGEAAFHMTLNRERMQAILEEVGRADIRLPDSIDGAIVAVNIPRAVVAMYGDCRIPLGITYPSGQAGQSPAPVQQKIQSLNAVKEEHCVRVIQVPSPTVSVPPNLNMAEIAQAGLELAGMSPAEAEAFCQTVDWSSTLVIPVPRDKTSSQTVSVDGVEGSLISDTRPEVKRYALIWVKNGIIYSLSGRGSSADALNLAESLR